MAFRATQRVQPTRQISFHAAPEESQSIASQQRQRTLEDSQEEWVLFSPTAPSVTQTETTSTDRTPRTPGATLISDFGSVDTAAAHSDNAGVDVISDNATEHASDQDEDADLDSLDDGLHAFHEPSDLTNPLARLTRGGDTVLPTHDGLGAFGESSAIQDHLRQFERYATKRKHKRRSSVQQKLVALEEVEEQNDEIDKMRWIEQWRLEQSRALLEEIERETRRMRRMSRVTAMQSRTSTIDMQTKSETNFSESEYTSHPTDTQTQISTIPEDGPPENESFWQRFTRRVIRDLIGIDEAILSVILGESLPEEAQNMSNSTSSSSEANVQREVAEVEEEYTGPLSWQERLLERLARELGILVHQLSEHPGAFSTYLQTQEPTSYAGLPNTATIPEVTAEQSAPTPITSSSTLFPPTIQQQVADNADPSLWGIEEEAEADNFAMSSLPDPVRLRREQEYWEKELDVRMVFNFLKSRFSSDSKNTPDLDTDLPFGGTLAPTSPSAGGPQSPRRASNTSAYTAHRAAIIRQHHPLASGVTRRRERALAHHHNGITRRTTRTGSSSCASQSTKKSKRSSSSRNYWDVGGSVGSGGAGLGAWGEVSF